MQLTCSQGAELRGSSTQCHLTQPHQSWALPSHLLGAVPPFPWAPSADFIQGCHITCMDHRDDILQWEEVDSILSTGNWG